MRLAFILSCVVMAATVSFSQTVETPSQVSFVSSKDGTRIAVECAGKGPSLLIVHGGTGTQLGSGLRFLRFSKNSQVSTLAAKNRNNRTPDPNSTHFRPQVTPIDLPPEAVVQ